MGIASFCADPGPCTQLCSNDDPRALVRQPGGMSEIQTQSHFALNVMVDFDLN